MPDDPYGTMKNFDMSELARIREKAKKRANPPAEQPAAAAEPGKPPAAPGEQPPPPAKQAAPPAKSPPAKAPPPAAKEPAPPPKSRTAGKETLHPAKAPAAAAAPAPAPAPTKPSTQPAQKLGAQKPKTLPEAVKTCPLGDEARKLLRDDLALEPYLHLLVQKKLYPDAVKLLAHALPKPEAIWWASRCAREVAGKEPPPLVEAALQSAEKWLKEPSEESCRAAMKAAEAVGFGSPAGCVALATFWTGGSLAPPNLPPVPPADDLTAKGAANAVLLAGVIKEPEKAGERYFQFVAEGIKIAMGILRPTEPSKGPTAKVSRA